jgi:hypothetical protein
MDTAVPKTLLISVDGKIRSYNLRDIKCTRKLGVCKNMECIKCYNNSLAAHEKCKCFLAENNMNPRMISKSSNKKYWFRCDKCPHRFETVICNITRGIWCPFCAGTQLCKNDDCIICGDKSAENNDKVQYWSDRNKIKPRDVFKSARDKYWFNCDKCPHDFEAALDSITAGYWCPFCASKQLCENDNCNECTNKSAASHDKAKYWSIRNKVKPRQVFKSSNLKYWFNCDKGHEFESRLSSITYGGTWCPHCVNKTETIVYDFLIETYGENNVISQYTTNDYINIETNRNYRFDFFIPDKKIIIELDGRQHFENVSNWTDCNDTLNIDVYKMNLIYKDNLSIIRLLQEEVWHNKINWKKLLIENIKLYDIPKVILLTENKDIYIKHMEKYNSINSNI